MSNVPGSPLTHAGYNRFTTNQEESMDMHRLAKEVQSLRRQNRVLFGMVSVLAATLCIGAVRQTGGSKMEELTVERINVVEADGRLAMVIANSGRLPGAIIDGEEKLQPRNTPGMLFYNNKGDECGGLIYTSAVLEDGTEVGYVHLSLDQVNQNQVVRLQAMKNWRALRNGLTIIDRPTDMTMAEVLDLQQRAGTDADARTSLQSLNSDGRIGADRVFVGSRDRQAAIELNDQVGRTRLRLYVSPEGEARLEFLGEDGAVVRSITPDR